MKKLITAVMVSAMLFVAVPVHADPIVITQQEIHDNVKLLNVDKQKYMFDIASFKDIKSRDIALDKLRITIYLINEWESHLSSNNYNIDNK